MVGTAQAAVPAVLGMRRLLRVASEKLTCVNCEIGETHSQSTCMVCSGTERVLAALDVVTFLTSTC